MDVVKLPRSRAGNQYAVVFINYLTKWPEAFAVPDQSAATIAKLLVEEVVARHGVPAELLSNRGAAFLSGLMGEVEMLPGLHKVNTSAYHPQTDGLAEQFHQTLITMLAKTVEKWGRNWDQHLPHVLFTYRACQQQSTQESPFFLFHWHDPRLPNEAALSHVKARSQLDHKEYGMEVASEMAEVWRLDQACVGRAQKVQKSYYNWRARSPNFLVGERE